MKTPDEKLLQRELHGMLLRIRLFGRFLAKVHAGYLDN